MAAKKVSKVYRVIVDMNKNYCGEGAGGAQFAHGSATITDEWLAQWYRTHEGYTVEEIKESDKEATDGSEKK